MLMLKFVRGNQISSFGPDAGAACVFYFLFFTDDGCRTTAGAHVMVRYPGIADLSPVKWIRQLAAIFAIQRQRRVLVDGKKSGCMEYGRWLHTP